jgi:hypothetical protein
MNPVLDLTMHRDPAVWITAGGLVDGVRKNHDSSRQNVAARGRLTAVSMSCGSAGSELAPSPRRPVVTRSGVAGRRA